MADTVDVVRAKLLSHFSETPEASQGERWAKLWDDGTFLPWDRGQPNPALADTLQGRQDMLGPPWTEVDGSRRRKRALVPGCGRGYDVLLLASFGYDALGLEISESAIDRGKEYARDHAKDFPPHDMELGAGTIGFLQGDFFKDDWLNQVDSGTTFDLIYDYTVLKTSLFQRELPSAAHKSRPCYCNIIT